MAHYLTRRLAASVGSLVFIAAATFFLMHAIPGGPFSSERSLPPAIEANLRRKFHIDQPVWKQFVEYMAGIARGDLGPSFGHEDRTTNDIICDGFPKSAALGLTA